MTIMTIDNHDNVMLFQLSTEDWNLSLRHYKINQLGKRKKMNKKAFIYGVSVSGDNFTVPDQFSS